MTNFLMRIILQYLLFVGLTLIAADARATSICNEALLLFEKYMEMHTKMMPDRGTEGTLINLWHGPMYGLKVLRKTIGNIPMDAPIKEEKSSDAPPLPILIKKG